MLKTSSLLLLLLTVVTSTSVILAAPNFEDHIKPIFEQSCNNCHNPDKAKGDLDLSNYSAALRGGSGGKVAEPGEGASSKLYGVITHTLEPKMPEKGDKIDKKEADLIRAWIDGGMLENKTGKPKKKSKPAFALSAAPSVGKPEGPPPMPKHLLLEPVVMTSRATSVNDMAASPWAPLLAIAAQYQVLLYNTDTLELAAVLPFEYGQPEVLSFHPSGKYLLAGGGVGGKSGTTVTWEIETGNTVLRAGKDFDSVLAASLRSDLGGVSLGGPGKRVKLWNTTTDEQLISIKKHTDWVTQLAYSPDGVLLASGGRGGGVYVWEAETGNEFHNLRAHQAGITGVAWRSDSNLLASASEDGNVIIWEMNNGKQVKKIPAHTGGVLAIDWTRTGELVSSGRDKKVKIWKPDFNLLKELPAFSNMIVEVSFSHDGKRLFCADWAGIITVWDVATAKQVGTICANPPSIADQIISIQKEIAELPKKTAELETAAKVAEARLSAGKSILAKEEADYQNSQAKQKKLTIDRTKFDAQLKSVYAQGEKLKNERQQKQIALTQARDKLNQHNALVAASRKSVQQVDREAKKLTSQEKQFVQAEQKAKKQAAAQPDDVALQQAASKATSKLQEHRKLLVEKNKQRAQQNTALAQLTEQRKGPGNRLAEAETNWKSFNNHWKAHQSQQKETQAHRNGINKPLADTQKKVKDLDTKLKNTRKKLPEIEQAHKKAKISLTQIQQLGRTLENRFKHWHAAAINADALRLGKEADALSAQQYETMDDFTRIAAEIEKIKDPAKLKEKSRQLAEHRKAIDQSAQGVLAKSREASAKKSAYQNALAH
jgi:WD40 repeat protein